MKLEIQTETIDPLETEGENSYVEAGKKELLERFQMQIQEYEDQRKGVDLKLKKVQSDMYMIKRIAECNIHYENKLFEGYRKKNEIFTLMEEGRFCDQQKRKVQALIKEVENLETKESLEL